MKAMKQEEKLRVLQFHTTFGSRVLLSLPVQVLNESWVPEAAKTNYRKNESRDIRIVGYRLLVHRIVGEVHHPAQHAARTRVLFPFHNLRASTMLRFTVDIQVLCPGLQSLD